MVKTSFAFESKGVLLYDFFVVFMEKIGIPMEDKYRSCLTVTQYRTLCKLDTHPDITMSELAYRMRVPNQRVTTIVESLVALDLVTRRFDDCDRRLVKVSLSPNGQKMLDDPALDWFNELKSHFDEIYTPQEEQQIEAALEMLIPLFDRLPNT